MPRVELTELLDAGAHFGHITRRWNPKMKPYIFMEKNGIHLLDLKKTQDLIEIACDELTKLSSEGKRILFIGTKKQAKSIIETEAKRCNEFYIVDRWLGGLLTNFVTIRRSVKRLNNLVKMETDGTYDKITKKEILIISRERQKLETTLSGIADMVRLPGALFVVDIKKELISVLEAKRLAIPVFAIVDTNTDPSIVDYPIPANDDAVKSIQLISETVADAVIEGKEVYAMQVMKDAEQAMKEEEPTPPGEEKHEPERPKRKQRIQRKRTENRA
ncbi:MAG: 30S ribosomal protein S2 [Ignavibacteria bacterium]|nr:30S ribosomal protein S2 [Ignavibacteria bacterium]